MFTSSKRNNFCVNLDEKEVLYCERGLQFLISIQIKQKMQSIQQLIREPELQSVRSPLGIDLLHINPKIPTDQMHMDDQVEFYDHSSSIIDLPKFATVSNTASKETQKNLQPQNHHFHEKLFRNKSKEHTVLSKREADGNFLQFLKVVIWICYLFGTAETGFQTIKFDHIMDLIGVSIAMLSVMYKLFKQKKSPEFDDFLHTYSLALTITLFAYSPSPSNDYFLSYVNVFRSLRLFFVMNMNFHFKDLVCKYAHKIWRVIKVSLPLLIGVLVLSVIFSQGMYQDIYNRCRNSFSYKSDFPLPLDDQLCGARSCADGQFCLNPMTFDLKPQTRQIQSSSILAFGYFHYKDLQQSIFTTWSAGTISQSTRIISMFINSSPVLLVVLLNILSIVFVQFYMTPALLVLFQQQMNESAIEFAEKKVESSSEEEKNPYEGGGDLSSVAAPTFGPFSSKQMENYRFKQQNDNLANFMNSDSNDKTPAELAIAKEGDLALKVKTKLKSVKIITPPHSDEVPVDSQSCWFKLCKCTALAFTTLICAIHFALAVVFAIVNLSETSNKNVGVCLAVIFIVWTFLILMKLYNEFFEDEEECSEDIKQAKNLILRIQIIIYLVNLIDYISRATLSVLIMEETSTITPLSTALLFLRIVYIPILAPSFHLDFPFIRIMYTQIRIIERIIVSIFPYVLFMVIVSIVIACISIQLMPSGSFIMEIVKYLSIFSNSNWVDQYQNLQQKAYLDRSRGAGFSIRLVLIVIGELLVIKMMISEGILIALRYLKEDKLLKQVQDQPEEQKVQEVVKQIKEQSTFFILPYDFLNIRCALYSVIRYEDYQTNKHRLLIIYIVFVFLGYIFMKDSSVYSIIALIIDFVLLADAVISIIALRFWGIGSFVNDKWYNLVNFFVNIVIITNYFIPFSDPLYLRCFRVFLLIQFIPSLKTSYQLISQSCTNLLKMGSFLGIVWLFLLAMIMMVIYQFTGSTGFQPLSAVGKSLIYSIRMLEKGSNLSSQMSSSFNFEMSAYFSMQNTLFYLFLSLPLQCLCIGLMLNTLIRRKEKEQQIQVQNILLTIDKGTLLTAKEQFQKEKIRRRILALRPTFNPIAYIGDSFLANLFSSRIYQNTKFTIQLISAILLLSIFFFNTHMQQNRVFILKMTSFFFYTVELLLFIAQSVAFSACNPNFKWNLIYFVLSIPGAFVLLVPFHKIAASDEMRRVLQIILMLGSLSLLQIIDSFSQNARKILKYLSSKIDMTVSILIWMFFFTALIASIFTSFFKKDFLVIFGSVFVGLCGGSYQHLLEDKQSSEFHTFAYLIEILTFFTGLSVRSCLLAVFLFETMQQIIIYKKPTKPLKGDVEDSVVSNLFAEDKLMEYWNGFDTKGSGMLPVKTILYQLPLFCKCFGLYRYYIEFLLTARSSIYPLKLQLFRKLRMPIHCAIIDSDESPEHSYVITLYDLVARFICLALNERYMLQDSLATGFVDKHESLKVIDWGENLGFDAQQWVDKQLKVINQLNRSRKEEEQMSQQFYLQRKVEFDSWTFSSLLKVYPIFRKRMSKIKQKKH